MWLHIVYTVLFGAPQALGSALRVQGSIDLGTQGTEGFLD